MEEDSAAKLLSDVLIKTTELDQTINALKSGLASHP